jgi:hypothetical protein
MKQDHDPEKPGKQKCGWKVAMACMTVLLTLPTALLDSLQFMLLLR